MKRTSQQLPPHISGSADDQCVQAILRANFLGQFIQKALRDALFGFIVPIESMFIACVQQPLQITFGCKILTAFQLAKYLVHPTRKLLPCEGEGFIAADHIVDCSEIRMP